MALGVSPEWLYHQCGHEGTQRENGFKPVGFHLQEMIEYTLRTGRSVTPIEFFPSSLVPTNSGDYDRGMIHEINFKEGNVSRVLRYMKDGFGVLLGKSKRFDHAVAWNGYRIFDPKGKCYLLSEAESHNFQPHTFLLILKINC